jgi:hypothetical protein
MKQHAKNSKYVYLIYFFWPFASLILAIKNHRSSWAKNIIWLFVVFYGYTMIVVGDSSDSTRERDALMQLNQSHHTFSSLTGGFYAEEGGELDIANPLILFIVSIFTSNYHILFVIYGLIFGFFYSRNIWLLIEYSPRKIAGLSLLLIFAFALVDGFWNINGFRFWCATQIFVYGLLKFLVAEKRNDISFIVLSALFHFSYMLPVGVFLIYFFIGNRLPIYFYFYLFSFTVKELNFTQLGDILKNILPGVFHNRVEIYANDEYAEVRKELVNDTTWHVLYSALLIRWIIISFLFIIYTKAKNIRSNPIMSNLFNFSLLIAGVANIAALVPSGIRFVILSNFIILAFIYLYFQYYEKIELLRWWQLVAIPGLIFFDVFTARVGLEAMGLLTIIGNPILATFFEEKTTIIVFIKNALGIKLE